MRLDPKAHQGWLVGAVTIEKYAADAGDGAPDVYGVNVYGVCVSEWSTRRVAERHAARIRKALKGER